MMRPASPTAYAAALLAAALLAGCARADAPPDAESVEASGAAPGDRIPGTPEGGLREWVADIRTGVKDLGTLVREDAAAAEKSAVDLYVGRQEWLERYWGTYGVLARDVAPALGRAVMDAEARFHELLVVLASSDRPDAAHVDAAVKALEAQLDQVLARASDSGVSLVPPAAAGEGSR